VDDIGVTLQMLGSAYPTCYKLSMFANNGSAQLYTCQTGSNGACTISKGSGSYNDNSTITMKVEKTCDTTKLENVGYTVIGHL
jgi:hypothetical protein